MVRLTSVGALTDFEWPVANVGDSSGTVDCRLAVTDPLGVDDGVYRLRVTGGTATVDRVADTPDDGATDPDATVGIGTLSQLAVGASGVATAARIGTLSVDDDRLRERLANVFQPGTVRLRQFF
jgi:hypothetical protein